MISKELEFLSLFQFHLFYFTTLFRHYPWHFFEAPKKTLKKDHATKKIKTFIDLENHFLEIETENDCFLKIENGWGICFKFYLISNNESVSFHWDYPYLQIKTKHPLKLKFSKAKLPFPSEAPHVYSEVPESLCVFEKNFRSAQNPKKFTSFLFSFGAGRGPVLFEKNYRF